MLGLKHFVDFGIPRWPVVHLPEAAHGLVARPFFFFFVRFI